MEKSIKDLGQEDEHVNVRDCIQGHDLQGQHLHSRDKKSFFFFFIKSIVADSIFVVALTSSFSCEADIKVILILTRII